MLDSLEARVFPPYPSGVTEPHDPKNNKKGKRLLELKIYMHTHTHTHPVNGLLGGSCSLLVCPSVTPPFASSFFGPAGLADTNGRVGFTVLQVQNYSTVELHLGSIVTPRQSGRQNSTVFKFHPPSRSPPRCPCGDINGIEISKMQGSLALGA